MGEENEIYHQYEGQIHSFPIMRIESMIKLTPCMLVSSLAHFCMRIWTCHLALLWNFKLIFISNFNLLNTSCTMLHLCLRTQSQHQLVAASMLRFDLLRSSYLKGYKNVEQTVPKSKLKSFEVEGANEASTNRRNPATAPSKVGHWPWCPGGWTKPSMSRHVATLVTFSNDLIWFNASWRIYWHLNLFWAFLLCLCKVNLHCTCKVIWNILQLLPTNCEKFQIVKSFLTFEIRHRCLCFFHGVCCQKHRRGCRTARSDWVSMSSLQGPKIVNIANISYLFISNMYIPYITDYFQRYSFIYSFNIVAN